jgi:probable DNA metabolism protein
MTTFLYDKTFEGLLTLVFESFRLKANADVILGKRNYQVSLLDNPIEIETDIEKAERVWKGLLTKTSKKSAEMIYHAFLSEMDGVEMWIYKYLKLAFSEKYDVSVNYREESVLQIKQIQQSVLREAHRMFMFVRFQRTSANIYFSPIQPVYDVIPLIGKHFKNRFKDQIWVIYDTLRNYGLYYDKKNVQEIKLEQQNYSKSSGKINASLLEEKEETYQILWKNYFDSINIKERKNLKVQMQFMPKRFWNYLPEMNE